MTDLWSEKPKIRAIDMRYQHTGGDYADFYEVAPMDTWLEKLKAEFDRSQKEGLEHHDIAVGYYEKLEAVRLLMLKWEEDVKEYPDTVKGIHARAAVNLCRKEVEEILEAEVL